MKVSSLFLLGLLVPLLLSPTTAANEQRVRGLEPEKQIFIVVLNPNDSGTPVAEQARAIVRAASNGAQEGFIYQTALRGFSLSVPAPAADAVVQAIERNPNVAYVEPELVGSLYAQTIPTGIRRIFAHDNANLDIDGTDDYQVDVDVAVLDSGVDFEHDDLNVVGGVDCTVLDPEGLCSAGGDDDHYHGTHVAGTIAALDNNLGVVGVAPGARIHAVKVCTSEGTCPNASILAGIDWVAAHGDIEVANMSLGGLGSSSAMYAAIQGAVDNGVAFAVAAGNSNADASNYVPAGFDNVLTVSSLSDFNGEPGGGAGWPWLNLACWPADVDDTLSGFSNWGTAVNIAAPGHCIESTSPGNSYRFLSGTSMASPHAAGALALLASTNPAADSTGVHALYDQVINAGNFDWTDDSGDGEQEPLLDVHDESIFPGSSTSGCTSDADCDDGLFCNGVETCDLVSGACLPGSVPACDDGVACTDDSCDSDTDSCVNIPNCDDGSFCNGVETCDLVSGVCLPGSVPGCDDGVACTDDSCDSDTDSCVNIPNCDDGVFCNGVEACNLVSGACLAGLEPACDDGVACTDDSCDSDTDSCVNIPINANCDDGLFCNGPETCHSTDGCMAGSNPCDEGQQCDETNDTCVNCGVFKATCTFGSDCCSDICHRNGKCTKP